MTFLSTGREKPKVVGESSQRTFELEALRGIAILGVDVFHCTNHYANEIAHMVPPNFGFPAGNHGVQLFFLISGS